MKINYLWIYQTTKLPITLGPRNPESRQLNWAHIHWVWSFLAKRVSMTKIANLLYSHEKPRDLDKIKGRMIRLSKLIFWEFIKPQKTYDSRSTKSWASTNELNSCTQYTHVLCILFALHRNQPIRFWKSTAVSSISFNFTNLFSLCFLFEHKLRFSKAIKPWVLSYLAIILSKHS